MLAAFTACQKDELPQSGAATSQTISVTVPQGIQTRATGDGDGSMVNRCILEIYRDGALYGERKVSTVTSGKATFSDLRLVAQQTYDFVFWADCADNGVDKYYDTESGLTQISAKEYKGNEERFDAFFLCQKDYKVEASFNETGWVLKRPFGQLNIKTDDLGDIPTELQPDAVSVVFKNLPTSFNALEGVTNEATQEEVTYKANILDAASGKLTVDYLWASEEESATLSDFTMTFLNNDTEICTNDAFTNIPIRRNYRTMVSGNLLTKKGTINVTIAPEFEGNIPQDVDQVKDIAAANAAFAAGKTNVIVTDVPTEDATLILPSTEAPVSATLPALTKGLKVQYSDIADAKQPASFHLTASSSATVEIDAAASTVTLAGTNYSDVTATTAANTLIVSEETTIDKLTVKSGNVEVYGTVKAIASKPAATTVTLHTSTAAKLQEFAAGVKAGTNLYNKVVLDADIDFKGAAFQIEDARNIEFDGQGHKLSNYKVENTQTAGLVCNAVSVTFRNLIVENAAVKAVNDGSGNAYAGVFVGRSYGTIVFANRLSIQR